MIEELIYRHNGQFKVSFSISGIVLELLQQHRPDVIASFSALVNTDCVEILAETYYHSLSFLHSKKEFERQVLQHSITIESIFNIKPRVFRNTELIYNNRLAEQLKSLGYTAILCEGVDGILNGRTASKVYAAPGESSLPLLIRNGVLSDDIAFRFDDANWSEHPLTAEKFTSWIAAHSHDTEVINLFMDYETFGVHKKSATGIFDFLEALPKNILDNTAYKFSTPSEVIAVAQAQDLYDVPETISWEHKANREFVWCTNVMQNNMLRKIYSLEKMVLGSGNQNLVETWGKLQCADYFYYMANNHAGTFGQRYLNPYQSPEEVFNFYKNIVTDFEILLINKALRKIKMQQSPFHASIY